MDDIAIRTDFPRAIREIENTWIAMPDGVKLAARIWLPEDAEADPVPAILEYLPYRKRDGTVERDHMTHPYFAGHGYAGVRVDMRGTGDSEGICLGEYLKQEQDDALAVIDWLASQPWCSGKVGMIGISWGGFNGLQIAARRPPALGAESSSVTSKPSRSSQWAQLRPAQPAPTTATRLVMAAALWPSARCAKRAAACE